MNLPIAKLTDVQEPVREADVFDKTKYTATELIALSSRFHSAAINLDVARAARSWDGFRNAYSDLVSIRDQTSQMLEGLQHAIENEQERKQ